MDIDEATKLRDDLELMESFCRTIAVKLDQFIEGEITEDEYRTWVQENENELSSLDAL